MTGDIYCIVSNRKVRDTLVEVMNEAGFTYNNNSTRGDNHIFLYQSNSFGVCQGGEWTTDYKQVSIEQLLEEIELRKSDIKVGNKLVHFDKKGESIIAEGTTFSYELVKEIVSRMKGIK